MENLSELLKQYGPTEPDEYVAIKKYISDNFKVAARVGAQGENLIISVPSAALAGTLRFHLIKIQEAAKTTKRLIIRIN